VVVLCEFALCNKNTILPSAPHASSSSTQQISPLSLPHPHAFRFRRCHAHQIEDADARCSRRGRCEGKRSKQEGLSMSCITCCWRKYSSCRFGRTMRHKERTEHKKATKLSNLFPWRGQYKKSSGAFDLCPKINIPRKTTPLYLGICQMTPKLFPKVFSLSGFQGFGSKSPDSIYSQIRKRRDVKVGSKYCWKKRGEIYRDEACGREDTGVGGVREQAVEISSPTPTGPTSAAPSSSSDLWFSLLRVSVVSTPNSSAISLSLNHPARLLLQRR
jgi:hypothetical protein